LSTSCVLRGVAWRTASDLGPPRPVHALRCAADDRAPVCRRPASAGWVHPGGLAPAPSRGPAELTLRAGPRTVTQPFPRSCLRACTRARCSSWLVAPAACALSAARCGVRQAGCPCTSAVPAVTDQPCGVRRVEAHLPAEQPASGQ